MPIRAGRERAAPRRPGALMRRPRLRDSGRQPQPSEDEQRADAEARRRTRAYQGAVEASLAVLIAAAIGYWADTQLETEPWGLIGGVIVGFAAMVLRLVRLGREMESSGEHAPSPQPAPGAAAARDEDDADELPAPGIGLGRFDDEQDEDRWP